MNVEVEKVEIPNATADTFKVNLFGLAGMIGLAPPLRRAGLEIFNPGDEGYVVGALVGLYNVVDYRIRYNRFIRGVLSSVDQVEHTEIDNTGQQG